MQKKLTLPIFLFLIICLSFTLTKRKKISSEAAWVTVKKEKERYQLYVNSEPYFIKGAGGYKYYDKLKACGGNSVRIWSTEGAKEYLDKAHELGLTVTLGLDLGHERLGFNYSDKKKVKEQFERVKKEILQYKDHPALLMWGVGNEVEQFAKNYEMWDALNDIMKYIHEVDPRHPTTTMLAGVPVLHIAQIAKRCPNLDILSINAFRWIAPVREDITKAGWTGPYMIGEWGASGYWESETVPWGTFLEETSTEKASLCAERYKTAIEGNTDRCLGSYVFLWGWKQARTHTLLSLFTEDGYETGTIDILHKLWTDKERDNRAPLIEPVGIDTFPTHKGVYLKPGSQHFAYTNGTDPDNDQLYYYWEIYHESAEKKEGGDTEKKPEALPGLVIEGKGRALTFKAPEKEGPYRVFAYVYDGKNHLATANAPFYVRK